MIVTKMENGINKINNFNFKFCLLITFFLFSFLNSTHSSSNPWDCKKDENVDYQTLIKEFEKSSKV